MLLLQRRYRLKTNKEISKLIAALLVLLLTLSITPKSFLHEMLADHKDAPSCNDVNLESPCIHKQGYSCQQSDVVVPNCYLGSDSQGSIVHANCCDDKKYFHSFSYTQSFTNHSHGRAPPAHV